MRQLFHDLEFRDIVALAVIIVFLIVGLGYAAEIAAVIQAVRTGR